MYNKQLCAVSVLGLTLAFIVSNSLYGSPTGAIHQNLNQCDFLSIPSQVDELGQFGIFPPGEEIDSVDGGIASPVCVTDDPTALDLVVEMRNLTGKTFEQVWYVANPGTFISNADGIANAPAFPLGHHAFRIDNDLSDPFGIHHPLIGEIGGIPDGLWQPGETWRFVLQDYANGFGLSHAAIDSIGIGDASPLVGVVPSSGSIIAIVPEPATCGLLLFGLAGSCLRWNRHH